VSRGRESPGGRHPKGEDSDADSPSAMRMPASEEILRCGEDVLCSCSDCWVRALWWRMRTVTPRDAECDGRRKRGTNWRPRGARRPSRKRTPSASRRGRSERLGPPRFIGLTPSRERWMARDVTLSPTTPGGFTVVEVTDAGEVRSVCAGKIGQVGCSASTVARRWQSATNTIGGP